MKNLKKLVSVVLSLAMVISMMTFTASAKTYGDVETTSKYFEAVDILSSLGILQGDENGNFNGDAEIKRSEFAAVVCRALGQENAAEGSATEQRFTDVASNHWAAGYINWAAGQKIVNGKGDGIFDPDAPVKYEEAVKMLVVALGYEPLAARKGGYPTGYMVVAASNGINSGVSLAGSANAPRYVVAQLTYNALDVPLMDSSYVSVNGQDEYNVYDGTDYARRTILSYYLDIAKVKAEVTANGTSDSKLLDKDGSERVAMTVTNLYKFDYSDVLDIEKDDLKTSAAKIEAYVGDSNASSYLGYTVIAYIFENEDGDFEVKAITSDAKSVDTLEVTEGFETIDYDTATFEYYENENDTRPEEVDLADNFTVYMNGFELTGSDAKTAFNDIKDKASKVVFMGDKGDDYNKVFITQYAYALVDSVVAEDEVIKFKEATTGVGNQMDLSSDERGTKFSYTIVDEDGTAVELADLAENDVLNILCAYPTEPGNSKVYTMEIIVSKGAVEGTVTEEIDKAEGEYAIDDVEYKIAHESSVTLDVGDEGRYYLTIDGKIFAEDEDYEADATSGKNYGFITAVGTDSKFGENYYQVKMFTKDGSLATYDIADTLYVYEDGKKDSYSRSKGEQAEFFNDGTDGNDTGGFYDLCKNVTTTDKALSDSSDDYKTAVDNASNRVIAFKLNASGEIKEIKDADTLDMLSAGAASYKENSEKFASKSFTSKSVLFNAPVKLVTATSGNYYTVDEDDVEVVSFTSLDEDETYNNTFLYDLNSKKEIGLALVLSDVATSKKDSLAVVTGVSTVSDDRQMIRFFQNGETKSYVLSDNCALEDQLDAGDIFQYTLVGDEISKGTKIYDYDKDTKPTLESGIDTKTITYKAAVVKEVKNKYVTTFAFGEDWDDVTAKNSNVTFTDYDFINGSEEGTSALYNTDRSGKNAVSKLAGLNAMKYNDSATSKYVYVVVMRMDEGEVVDAIEYQYSMDDAVAAGIVK